MDNAVLRVRQCGVHLSHRLVLDQVDLQIKPGEIVGLIGPNGAGKTTLIRAILGLVPLSAGEIRIGGHPPVAARAQVGYVPQRHEFAWDFPVSVIDAVLSGRVRSIGWARRPRPTDRAVAIDALERVGLKELEKRPISQLSGGQRQRVLVARALAQRPSLLLLDEPFSGVDTPTQEVLTVALQTLRAEGATVLIATHDLAWVQDSCTRCCMLNHQVVFDGDPRGLSDPANLLRAFGLRLKGHELQGSVG